MTEIVHMYQSHAYDGHFISEGSESRAAKSFISETLQKSVSATLSTAIGYCLYNIVDNIRSEKTFDFREWASDILDCGHSFDWSEMMTQAAVWGTASGVVHGGAK